LRQQEGGGGIIDKEKEAKKSGKSTICGQGKMLSPRGGGISADVIWEENMKR
jgi:hypothetical protein